MNATSTVEVAIGVICRPLPRALDGGVGIVVRNSIILVDLIELRLRDGVPLDQLVVDAGAIRWPRCCCPGWAGRLSIT